MQLQPCLLHEGGTSTLWLQRRALELAPNEQQRCVQQSTVAVVQVCYMVVEQ